MNAWIQVDPGVFVPVRIAESKPAPSAWRRGAGVTDWLPRQAKRRTIGRYHVTRQEAQRF